MIHPIDSFYYEIHGDIMNAKIDEEYNKLWTYKNGKKSITITASIVFQFFKNLKSIDIINLQIVIDNSVEKEKIFKITGANLRIEDMLNDVFQSYINVDRYLYHI